MVFVSLRISHEFRKTNGILSIFMQIKINAYLSLLLILQDHIRIYQTWPSFALHYLPAHISAGYERGSL